MRVQSSAIYIRHTRLRILCYAYRSHVLYFPRFWPGSTHFFPPLLQFPSFYAVVLFALHPATSTTINIHAGACVARGEREKKKKKKKENRFREKQLAIPIHTRHETTVRTWHDSVVDDSSASINNDVYYSF